AVVDDPALLAGTGLTAADAAPDAAPRDLFGLPGSGGEPVMRLAGSVLSLKPLRAGEGVSYNATHVAARDTRIALVSGGFGQGVARSLGNRVQVEIGGRRHPIVGRVAMDVCVVDVAAAPIAADDEVVYFGGTGPARDALAEWEAASGLRGTELVCALGLRLPRELDA
ncbi:MAG: alanine racemase C-terminal domain-containing protein, partial [Microbacterium sp.]|uniref:alanine racemase C-terminal domain-containing protein n=1 Tax=Microbacterium sp. TaxID=51671 RepID=UPI0039E6EBE3